MEYLAQGASLLASNLLEGLPAIASKHRQFPGCACGKNRTRLGLGPAPPPHSSATCRAPAAILRPCCVVVPAPPLAEERALFSATEDAPLDPSSPWESWSEPGVRCLMPPERLGTSVVVPLP